MSTIEFYESPDTTTDDESISSPESPDTTTDDESISSPESPDTTTDDESISSPESPDTTTESIDSQISYKLLDESESLNDLLKPEVSIGCKHYKTKCKLICPVCDNSYFCRFCHDDIEDHYTKESNVKHMIDRHAIEEIVCFLCDTRQPISATCSSCNITFASYFCNKCNLYDDDGLTKGIYHCDKCGICRVGNTENFYHCDGCNTCISINIKESHECMDITDEMCPVCNEQFFTTRISIFKLPCNHWIHTSCFKEMLQHGNLTCPFCSKLMVDMSDYYQQLDVHIANSPMPEEYADKRVDILCNECVKTMDVPFHFNGLKCLECGSYNTKQIV